MTQDRAEEIVKNFFKLTKTSKDKAIIITNDFKEAEQFLGKQRCQELYNES